MPWGVGAGQSRRPGPTLSGGRGWNATRPWRRCVEGHGSKEKTLSIHVCWSGNALRKWAIVADRGTGRGSWQLVHSGKERVLEGERVEPATKNAVIVPTRRAAMIF